MIRLHFLASNNIAQYEGLINGLRIAIELEATRLYAYSDTKLVVDKFMKESNYESSLMNTYCQELRKLRTNSKESSCLMSGGRTTTTPMRSLRWRSSRPRFQRDLHQQSSRTFNPCQAEPILEAIRPDAWGPRSSASRPGVPRLRARGALLPRKGGYNSSSRRNCKQPRLEGAPPSLPP
jgi:ribonuclease HI